MKPRGRVNSRGIIFKRLKIMGADRPDEVADNMAREPQTPARGDGCGQPNPAVRVRRKSLVTTLMRLQGMGMAPWPPGELAYVG